MKRKYIIYNAIVTTVALILMFMLGIYVTKNNNLNQAKDEIVRITNIYKTYYDKNNDYELDINNDIRVTIIDANGKVLSDSVKDSNTFDNHMNREEILNALNDNPKVSYRKSDSTNIDMIYYALKVNTDESYIFIRVAMPISSVNDYIVDSIVPMILILLASLFVSIILSYFFCINLLTPFNKIKENLESIANGNKIINLPTTQYDDINKVLVEINDIGDKIENNIKEIKDNKVKLDYILNNISNGIITFDNNDNIDIINASSKNIFNINNDIKNINYLTLDVELINTIKSIYSNTNISFEYLINGKYYYIILKKLNDNTNIMVLNDINESKTNEMMRSDFFANASHELKTPLTSIKGFTEVILLNNKDENITNYLNIINKETDRVLGLIEDMLKLSKLEITKEYEKNEIDLNLITKEVLNSLKPLIDEKKIHIDCLGSLKVIGEKEHFYELIKNLLENAIKYNYENGEVKIIFNKESNKNVIEVTDNGIGIDPENQVRIFERFYRVNKSRSRSTGGTGLGLAIVKHIVELYGGTIELKSYLGRGTSIKIIL